MCFFYIKYKQNVKVLQRIFEWCLHMQNCYAVAEILLVLFVEKITLHCAELKKMKTNNGLEKRNSLAIQYKYNYHNNNNNNNNSFI